MMFTVEKKGCVQKSKEVFAGVGVELWVLRLEEVLKRIYIKLELRSMRIFSVLKERQDC